MPISSTSDEANTAASNETTMAGNDSTTDNNGNHENVVAMEHAALATGDDHLVNADNIAVHHSGEPHPSTGSSSLPDRESASHTRMVVNPVARVLLAGVYIPSASPLYILRPFPEVVELIFIQLKKIWKETLRFRADDIAGSPLELMALVDNDQRSDGIVAQSYDVPDMSLELVKRHVEFPPPKDLYCNMLPFRSDERESLPPEFQDYWPLICDCADGGMPIRTTWYLTVHESRVGKHESQRRGGIHVEGFLAKSGRIHNIPPWFTWGWWKKRMRHEGGIFHASTVSNSCKIWRVEIPREESNVLQIGCDLEHLRGTLNESAKSFMPQKNELWWMTDAAPHESLPLEPGTYRQYFWLVVGPLSAWWSKHSTPNPLGIQPNCPIFYHSKFEEGAYTSYEENSDRALLDLLSLENST